MPAKRPVTATVATPLASVVPIIVSRLVSPTANVTGVPTGTARFANCAVSVSCDPCATLDTVGVRRSDGAGLVAAKPHPPDDGASL